MFTEDCSTQKPEAVVVIPRPHRPWTDAELAAIMGRRVIVGMLDGKGPEWVRVNARLAGSYARRVIEQQENFQDGLRVVTGAFGGR